MSAHLPLVRRGASAPIARLMLLVALVLPGCTRKPAPAPKAGPAAVSAPAKNPADEMLKSALFQLRPENLGIDSDPNGAGAVLNSWREQSPLFDADKFAASAGDLAAVPKGWLPEPAQERLLAREFNAADAVYIRDALLSAQMARQATDGKDAEIDRVVAMFDAAMRTVMLQPVAVPQLPFPRYELMLLGQGTPDDRAWVFAMLLKQQRVDAVLLQSKDDPEAKLVGAILDGEVYLFDCKLGVPIPRGEGDEAKSPLITRPATLRELEAHPDWWSALTLRADQPYPWNTEALAAADVLLIAEEPSWSGRMKQLETVLPADAACVLYDPLIDTPALASLAKRIAAGNPAWTPDKLKFWAHPLNLPQRMQAFGKNVQQLALLFQRMRSPLEVVKEKKERLNLNQDELLGNVNPFRNDEVIGGNVQIQPTDAHWKSRVEMLMGRPGPATAAFLSIRHLALENPPPELRADPQAFQLWTQLYRLAAMDASFWSAVCKLEQGDRAQAASALADYLRRNSRSDWVSAARYLAARTHAELKQFAEARAILAAVPTDDPHRPGLEVLAKRWEEAKETSEKPAENKPASEEGK